jgi:hypothetical protein
MVAEEDLGEGYFLVAREAILRTAGKFMANLGTSPLIAVPTDRNEVR